MMAWLMSLMVHCLPLLDDQGVSLFLNRNQLSAVSRSEGSINSENLLSELTALLWSYQGAKRCRSS